MDVTQPVSQDDNQNFKQPYKAPILHTLNADQTNGKPSFGIEGPPAPPGGAPAPTGTAGFS